MVPDSGCGDVWLFAPAYAGTFTLGLFLVTEGPSGETEGTGYVQGICIGAPSAPSAPKQFFIKTSAATLGVRG
jgi:hypothetical protein